MKLAIGTKLVSEDGRYTYTIKRVHDFSDREEAGVVYDVTRTTLKTAATREGRLAALAETGFTPRGTAVML